MNYYIPFLHKPAVKALVLVAFAALTAVCLGLGSRLGSGLGLGLGLGLGSPKP